MKYVTMKPPKGENIQVHPDMVDYLVTQGFKKQPDKSVKKLDDKGDK